jgi:hypothetical protein
MMTSILIFGGLALVLLTLLVVFVRMDAARLPAKSTSGERRDPRSEIFELSKEDFSPRHYLNFALARRALSVEDEQFLALRAAPAVRRRARCARRAVVLQFLGGLQEDYRRLNRVSRILTSLSPTVDRQHEYQRWWLAARFELLCAFASLKLRCGVLPVSQMRRLTDLIGNLTIRLERAMRVWEEAALKSQPAGVRT